MISTLYSLTLLGTLLFGLVLLVVGIVLLLKLKNKLAGSLVSAVGLMTSSFSVLIFLFLTVTSITVR